jgi:hypothetical protein
VIADCDASAELPGRCARLVAAHGIGDYDAAAADVVAELARYYDDEVRPPATDAAACKLVPTGCWRRPPSIAPRDAPMHRCSRAISPACCAVSPMARCRVRWREVFGAMWSAG